MSRAHTLDILNEALFDNNADLTTHERDVATRLRDAFVVWLEDPMMTDAEIRDYLMLHYQLSKSQAYRDIANLKVLLGNVRNAGKEWYRHRVNFILEEAYRMAQEGKTAAAKALSAVATAIIKNNRLDQDDGEQYPWEEIIPQPFEPTSDPTVIGLKPIPNLKERINSLKKKYEVEITDVEVVADGEAE